MVYNIQKNESSPRDIFWSRLWIELQQSGTQKRHESRGEINLPRYVLVANMYYFWLDSLFFLCVYGVKVLVVLVFLSHAKVLFLLCCIYTTGVAATTACCALFHASG